MWRKLNLILIGGATAVTVLSCVDVCEEILVEHGFCSKKEFDDRVSQKIIKDIGQEQWELTLQVFKQSYKKSKGD